MTEKKRRVKQRGNGQGTVFRRGSTYTAQVVVGWKTSADGSHLIPVRRSRGGFASRKDAANYCAQLYAASAKPSRLTLQQLYDEWDPYYSPRVGKSCMDNYKYAFKHFAPLHGIFIDLITAADLQKCMDDCPAGKRTHENMRCTAGLLWAYALDRELVDRDITNNLYIGKGKTIKRQPITEQELEIIRKAIGKEPYAEYVYAQCFLGFRPGEFLALTKNDIYLENGQLFLIGGSKTEAGTDRLVPVPDAIRDIIRQRLRVRGTEYLFPRQLIVKDKPAGWKPMSHDYYNKHIFKPLMQRLGIAEGKTPYCARHTYANKLKNADGDNADKAAIMGHTDYAFTQHAYQTTSADDLKLIAKSLE